MARACNDPARAVSLKTTGQLGELTVPVLNRKTQTGNRIAARYRSGQTGQTVNLLALRLQWFESTPTQNLSQSHSSSGWF